MIGANDLFMAGRARKHYAGGPCADGSGFMDRKADLYDDLSPIRQKVLDEQPVSSVHYRCTRSAIAGGRIYTMTAHNQKESGGPP